MDAASQETCGGMYDIDCSLSDGFVFTLCVLDSTVEDFIKWNMEMLHHALYQNHHPPSFHHITMAWMYNWN